MSAVPWLPLTGLLLSLGPATLFALLKRDKQHAPVERRRHLLTMWGCCGAHWRPCWRAPRRA